MQPDKAGHHPAFRRFASWCAFVVKRMDDPGQQGLSLVDVLRVAKTMQASAQTASQERLAAVYALHACIEFVETHEKGLTIPLQKLAVALLDLDNGRVAPMLGTPPREKKSGPAISEAEVGHRLHAACIMHGLMKRAGMSKISAAKWISARLADAGHDVSFHTVIDWRKDANNRNKDAALNDRYRRLQAMSEPHWNAPIPYAETLIAKLLMFMPAQKEE